MDTTYAENIMHDTLSVSDSSFKHQVIILDDTHEALTYCSRPYHNNNCLVFAIVLAYPVHNVITCSDEAKSS